jgi:hypothetical protein
VGLTTERQDLEMHKLLDAGVYLVPELRSLERLLDQVRHAIPADVQASLQVAIRSGVLRFADTLSGRRVLLDAVALFGDSPPAQASTAQLVAALALWMRQAAQAARLERRLTDDGHLHEAWNQAGGRWTLACIEAVLRAVPGVGRIHREREWGTSRSEALAAAASLRGKNLNARPLAAHLQVFSRTGVQASDKEACRRFFDGHRPAGMPSAIGVTWPDGDYTEF